MVNGWADPYFEYPGLEKRARPKAPPPPPTPPPSPPEEEETWWEKAQAPWIKSFGEWWGREMAKQKALPTFGEEWRALPETWRKGFEPPEEPLTPWPPGTRPEWRAPPAWGQPPVYPYWEEQEQLQLLPRNLRDYERAYEDKPVREIPPAGFWNKETFQMDEIPFEKLTEEQKEAWLNAGGLFWLNSNAYGSIYLDESGRIMTGGEAQRMMIENPNAQLKKVFFLGSGEWEYVDLAARDLNIAEEMGLTEEQIGEMRLAAPEMATRRQSLAEYETGKAKILVSDLTYEEKVSALIDLYTDIKGGVTEAELAQLRTDVFESLPPEEQRARYQGWRPVVGEELEELPEGKAPKDVGKLTGAVSPFGISVLAEYPYLSPITEAHLRRLPQPVLEMMSRYLEERGLAWRDWLALSMGGGAMPGRMPAWSPVRQWG